MRADRPFLLSDVFFNRFRYVSSTKRIQSFAACVVAGLALLLASSSELAAENNQYKEGSMQSIMLTQCVMMNTQFRTTPGIAEVLKTRPEPAMCECVSGKMSVDPDLESLRIASEDDMQKRIEHKNFETFYVAKLSSIFFSCLSQELDAGIKNFPIE